MASTANNQPFIPLFKEYKEWCKTRLTQSRASGDYPSRLKKINREFISVIETGTKKTPLELLDKYLKSSKVGPKWILIDSLLAAISSRITLELKVRKKAGAVVSFGSERTAFNDYSTFVRDYVTSHPYRTNKIEPTEQAVLDYINEYEIVLDQSSLTAIFANRIGTQDRITGNKPFLPLGLLTTILPKGAIREWAKNAASHVLIHTSDCNVLVTDVDELTIDTKTQKVTVKLATGETQTVTNPPLNGHKDSMRINMISDTDIDHDPDIHSILIKMKGQLTALDWITSKILRTQESLGFKTINASNCNSIYSVLTSDCNFMDEAKVLQSAIIAELDLVTAHHKLQLASKVWNRSTKKHNKGNGI